MPETKKPQLQTVTISSLAELQTLCDATVPCRFVLDNVGVELPVKRATPAMEERRRAILRTIPPPPFSAERKDYVYLDPAYQARLAVAEREARAYVIYAGCPLIAANKPGLTEPKQILDYINTLPFPENVLEIIAATILAGGVDTVREVERVNFTWPPDSGN